ncbi:MAG: DUF342 domain-containing protein [Deltaproteobacteria bacterium]|nr:DUF342 domain-containing protein [Candidatus Anaeroferrophillus wilburensis]MBN2889509.1 DUF342 domain-containing protein [Deltaproteobacteria bacterium]
MSYQVTLYTHETKAKKDREEQNQVNHYEQNLIENVVASQVLARIRPLDDQTIPELGEDGNRQFFVVEDPAVLLGDNVIIPADDPQIIISTSNGYVRIDNNRIEVRETLVIDGDVNFKTGNLTFIGTIIVKGSVFAGFSVKARQLVVEGSIEGAHIEVDEHLIVRGGIIACKAGEVYCGGTIAVKYVENSALRAKGDIFIEKSALHSQLSAGGSIVFLHEPGVLVGGSCQAKNSVFAKVIGAKWATPTTIILGINPFLMEERKLLLADLEAKEAERQEVEERLNEIHLYLQEDHDQASRKEELRLDEERELLTAKRAYVDEQLLLLHARLHPLEEKIKLEKEVNNSSRLYAFDTLFPGVAITIKDSTIKCDSLYSGVFYYEENQELKLGKT